MMRNIFLLLLTLTFFTGRLAAQCNVVITNPAAVCYPSTVNLSAASVTAGSTAGLTFTYWTDAAAMVPYTTYTAATAGTYYIKGDNLAGCTQVKPVVVTVNVPPTATITYAGTPFCKSINTPQQVTLTGTGSYTGGTYSAPSGLTLNTINGSVTPSSSNAGTYIVTYTIPASGACPENPVTTSVTIVAVPTAPVIGTITPPTCTVSTGSVALSGLPSFGDWTLTVMPGGATATGNGTATSISGLLAGTSYTFRVTNYAGCISPSSVNAAIPSQPQTPTAPVVGTITPPTCTLATGSVLLSGLPSTGTWTLRRYPGSITTSSTGTSYTVSGLPTNTYNFSVTTEAGCVSPTLSDDVVIPAQPLSPSAPVIGTITQPTCALATGSVALSGLPSGTWTITLNPGGTTLTNNGSTAIFSGIPAGTYTFTVTGSNTCISSASSSVTINAQPITPAAPLIGSITQPTCAVPTGTVVLNSLPAGSWVLTRNPGGVTTPGTTTSLTISGLDPGTYSFTVTNASLCTSPSSAPVVINPRPASPGTPEFSINCALGFGHAVVTVTSPLGAGLEYNMDGGPYQASTAFASVANGNHYLGVRNSAGCVTTTGIFGVSCGCVNAPAVILSATSDTTCGTTAVTVSGNTFSGSATSVTITENGAGTVSPSSATTPSFSFTYTPGSSDRGRTVLITVTTNNPLGSPCSSAVATFTLTVNAIPSAPVIGTITHLTCSVSTGSVVLNGLPSTGTWTLTRHPDEVVTLGEGTTITESGIPAGTYTFSVASEEGCTSALSLNAIINPQPGSPTAPVVGLITQPTCSISTGSVVLSGLPATGTYILTRLPSGVTRTGEGATYTVPNIPSGTYAYTVTNSSGCVSPQSANVVIIEQPITPSPPSVGHITSPTCSLATGSVELLGLPTGTWKLTRYSGGIVTEGEGTSATVSEIPSGPSGATYNYTVTNSAGCISMASANVFIPAQPLTPTAPVVGTITQPTLAVPTGSVVLSGLPAGGWVINRLPDNVTYAGSGTSYTVTALAGGLYTFTVSNTAGCASPPSDEVTISTPGKPDVLITDPPPACSPGKVDLTAPAVTEGSTGGLTFTYWTDSEATQKYDTPEAADAGTYYIKGATVSGFFDIKPVTASTVEMPVANAGPDQSLPNQFSTALAAELGENETGTWSVESGKGVFADVNDPESVVSGLASGSNVMLWAVSNGACPADTDKVVIVVGNIIVPTLITPNGDTKNEYFVILGLESLGKTELLIFDRRGAEVFKNSAYDNKWNGVDYNENPLPNDTYFYLLKFKEGRSQSGYVVIRR
jgi:gliding motility-associated-like protein